MLVQCQYNMRKLLLSFCLVIFCLVSFGQVYQEMPQYGYRANRMAFDSTLQIPTVCGVPTLKSVVSVSKKAAIAFDSCNNKLYKYNPKTLTWSEISGGGTTPSLQEVTTVGDTTNTGIYIYSNNFQGANQIEIVDKDSISNEIATIRLGSKINDVQTIQLLNSTGGVNNEITLNQNPYNGAILIAHNAGGQQTTSSLTNTTLNFRSPNDDMWIEFQNDNSKYFWNRLLPNISTDTNHYFKLPNGIYSQIRDTIASLRDLRNSGMTALNGLSGSVQTFSTDSSNSNFTIISSGTNHKFNIPNASASGVTRGLISNTQYTTFNNKVGFTDTTSTIATKTNLALKVNISDTSAMLSKYLRKSDTTSMLVPYLRKSDTTAMLSPYFRKSDTASLSNRIDSKNYALNLGGAAITVNASTIYYFGTPAQTVTNSAAIRRIYIPVSGTLKGGQIYAKTTVATTTESWTLSLRLNNSSNTTFATVGNILTDKVFGTSSLNIAVVAGDYIEITTTTPAWVVGPGATFFYGTIFIQ